MKNAKKKTKWLRPRHHLVRNVVYALLYPYCRIVYGLQVKRFREQQKRPYLILLNHQTPFDQFFVGMSFKGPIYYLATEDIFSNGFISSVIRYLIAPIPIKKQTMDLKAIKTCFAVAREGGSLAIAPEGNRTYSGQTEYMNPSIAPLARKLGMPIVLYRIEGGYGAEPRWSNVIRRGRVKSYVSRVIDPEEYATMTDEELFEAIRTELYVNEAVEDARFEHKKSAEYLERAVYICPTCGLSRFESHGDTVSCQKCGLRVRYLPTKRLQGVDGDFPFPFVLQWYDYQKDFVNALDVMAYVDTPMYQESVALSRVIPYKKKVPVCPQTSVRLYGDRMELTTDQEQLLWHFDQVSAVVVLGRNKLNVYHGDDLWQFKGGKRFNALKYVHIYHRYQNMKKGDGHGKFLGL